MWAINTKVTLSSEKYVPQKDNRTDNVTPLSILIQKETKKEIDKHLSGLTIIQQVIVKLFFRIIDEIDGKITSKKIAQYLFDNNYTNKVMSDNYITEQRSAINKKLGIKLKGSDKKHK